MNQKKINLASINKTFLRPKQRITIPGYYIVRKDLPSSHGGGVTIFVRDDIPSNTFELDANNNRGNIVYVTVKIITKIHTELVICLSHFARGIVYEQLFEILDKKSNNFVMLNTLIWVQRKPMIAKLT